MHTIPSHISRTRTGHRLCVRRDRTLGVYGFITDETKPERRGFWKVFVTNIRSPYYKKMVSVNARHLSPLFEVPPLSIDTLEMEYDSKKVALSFGKKYRWRGHIVNLVSIQPDCYCRVPVVADHEFYLAIIHELKEVKPWVPPKDFAKVEEGPYGETFKLTVDRATAGLVCCLLANSEVENIGNMLYDKLRDYLPECGLGEVDDMFGGKKCPAECLIEDAS